MTEIERLAKVLWAARASFADSKTCPAWEELGAEAQEVYLMLVRAILTAMREPTPELIKAALVEREKRDPNIDDPWWIQDWLRDRLPHLWQAIIDKLLEEK